MERTKYPLNHEWHVAVNRHSDEQRTAGKHWREMSFMYEANRMADEVPRMAMLFKAERENAMPQMHQQCSMQAPVPVKDNHLSCCLGVKTRECAHLLALEKIERCTPDDVDAAKAWTCAAHIVSKGGDMNNEGYLLSVDRARAWLAQRTPLETQPGAPGFDGADAWNAFPGWPACEHHWKVTHQGVLWHDCRCELCGETKRETWD